MTNTGSKRSFILGIVASLILLVFVADHVERFDTNFDELALGKETQSKFAMHDGVLIHCTSANYHECLNPYIKSSATRNLLLWLGNSQLHAVNQLKPGERTASELVARALIGITDDYPITISDPNASLQEHLIILMKIHEMAPVDTILLPLVFDDMREMSLRPSVIRMLDDEVVAQKLRETDLGERIVNSHVGQKEREHLKLEEQLTLQEVVEDTINSELETRFSFWNLRGDIRAFIFEAAYNMRNSILGISASTTRPKIPAAYNRNLEALRLIFEYSKKHNIRILPYIAPIRSDVKIPYDARDYSEFKLDVRTMASGGDTFRGL